MSQASQIHCSGSAPTTRAQLQWRWPAGLLLLLGALCAMPGMAGPTTHRGTRTAQMTSHVLANSHALPSCNDYAHPTSPPVEAGSGTPAPGGQRESPTRQHRPQSQLKTVGAIASLQSPAYLLLAALAGNSTGDPAPRPWRDTNLQRSCPGALALRQQRGQAPPLG